MNERLLLALYDRSGLGAYMPVDYKGHELKVEKHIEKFAELIVGECLKLNSKELSITAIERLLPLYKEHFGIEE